MKKYVKSSTTSYQHVDDILEMKKSVDKTIGFIHRKLDSSDWYEEDSDVTNKLHNIAYDLGNVSSSLEKLLSIVSTK